MSWSYSGGTDPSWVRKLMGNISVYIRCSQYNLFVELIRPKSTDKIIDIGTSPDERLKDTNFFERKYPFPKMLSIASVEDCAELVKKYHLRKYIKLTEENILPLKNNAYDIVVSWATIEHVGNRSKQKHFLNELCRLGKKVFITTPDRSSWYEPHTATFFLHYFPKKLFRKILKWIGKDFWSKEENLNILSFKDVTELVSNTKLKVIRFRLFGILPSHIIIYGKNI